MRKIIVSAGYMGSGSSAVTDYLKEFKSCKCPNGSYEYVFLHCPNGLFDLEDRLLLGNNAIKSDYSIRTFKKEMKKLYDLKYYWVGNYKEKISNRFMNLTNEYINNITQYKYDGFWYTHEELNKKMFFKLVLEKPFKILFKKIIHFKKVLNTDGKMYISYIKPNDFYSESKKYIYRVINEIDNSNCNIVLDQLLLPFNLHRIDKYFDDDLKVIVVDRDPRDVFILNKYVWQKKNVMVPFPLEVEEFCKFYDNMRKSEKSTMSNKILRIHFEDLIYDYSNTSKLINIFVGLDESDHINKKRKLNPDISIKNTQIFRNSKYSDEIIIIEKELKEYLYDFKSVINNEPKNSVEEDEIGE